jgi:hypothetical protein
VSLVLQRAQAISILNCAIVIGEGSSMLGIPGGLPLLAVLLGHGSLVIIPSIPPLFWVL